MADAGIAPVVLLGYRRPDFTASVFERIAEARPSRLFLVMDGPKRGDKEDESLVLATRKVVEEVSWPCSVTRIYAPSNLGLKERVSSGLTEVFSLVDRAIILEDDCVPSPQFFGFASELLEKYGNDSTIGLISGASRLRGQTLGGDSYAFSRDVRIWGWATWSRTWNGFIDSGDLNRVWQAKDIPAVTSRFPTPARRRSIGSMLKAGATLDSWALPFAIHCVTRGYLNPVSAANLVRNIGFGKTSTHTRFESYVKDVPLEELTFPLQHPSTVSSAKDFDLLEALSDRREMWRYPVRHPIDTVSRFLRYSALMLTGRRQ